MTTTFTFGCVRKESKPENKPVVKLGNYVLTSQQLAKRLLVNMKGASALKINDPKNLNLAKESIINNFISSKIVERFAKKKGIIIKSETIDSYINQIRSSYPNDLSFKKYLNEQNLSFENWRKLIIERLTHEEVTKWLLSKVPSPTDIELKEYYKKEKSKFESPTLYKLKQIFLEKEEDADIILKSLKGGKSFSDLAKQYSESPEGKDGGELPPTLRGTLEVFDAAIEKKSKKALKFKSPYGFHVIKYIGRIPAKKKTFKEAKKEVKDLLMQKRQQAVYAKWLEKELSEISVWRDNKLIDSLQLKAGP